MIEFITTVAGQFTAQYLIAVGAATLCGIAIGFGYYAVLGDAWRQAAGMSEEDAQAGRSIGSYLIAGICYLILAFGLFGVTWHASVGDIDLRASLIAAGLAWLGFVVTTMTANHRFQGRPARLTVINAGHWLLVLMAQGLIIGLLSRQPAPT